VKFTDLFHNNRRADPRDLSQPPVALSRGILRSGHLGPAQRPTAASPKAYVESIGRDGQSEPCQWRGRATEAIHQAFYGVLIWINLSLQ
jgi:hypothetical protein